jgi:outer membrane autotransporter protein
MSIQIHKSILQKSIHSLTIFTVGCIFTLSANAADFTISDGQTLTTTQSLSGASEVGIIEKGGALNTTGAHAVSITGSGVQMSNGGGVSVTGNVFHGFVSIGSNTKITNSGIVSATGSSSAVFVLAGSDATITNSGTVSATGSISSGFVSIGSNTKITNSGIVSATGSSSFGFDLAGSDATITNSGIVSTTGSGSAVFGLAGSNATITNSGTVSATGSGSLGIESLDSNTTITNSGIVSATGSGSRGIESLGSNTTITNSGIVSTTGSSSAVFFLAGSNATITNSGIVSATGSGSRGIESIGLNAIITNSGTISVTDSNSAAIFTSGNNQTLNLLSGSKITGAITLNGTGDTVNISMSNPDSSSTLNFTGVETYNLSGDMAMIRNNDTVAIVDLTSQAAQRAMLHESSDQIHKIVNQRIRQNDDSGINRWARVFGSTSERDDDKTVLAHDSDYYGFVGGYDTFIGNNKVGGYIGGKQSDIESNTSSVKTQSNSFLLGAYIGRTKDNWSLNGSINMGYENNDSERLLLDNLAGYQTAESDYNNYYVSPAVNLKYNYKISNTGIEIRPSTQLSYTYGYYDSYSESGTTNSNLNFDSRDVGILGAKLQLGLAKTFAKKGEAEIYFGTKMRKYNSDKINVGLGSSSSSFEIQGEDSVLGYYVGTNIDYKITDSIFFNTDFEFTKASQGEKSITGTLGLGIKF